MAMVLSVVFAMTALAHSQSTTPPPPDIATAVYLTEYPNAKCLDGSPYAYYLRQAPKGSVNSTKWVFHLQGGGWCHDLESCWGRTQDYLGSSRTVINNYTNVTEFANVKCDNRGCGALMLNDPAINELSYDWNAVFMRYCDGMSFAANVSEPQVVIGAKGNGTKIWLRGLENLHSTFKSLEANYGLGDSTLVLTGGASAGGLATYFHADTMTDLIHEANTVANKSLARVIAMPDSGFWPDDINERFTGMFEGWFNLQQNSTAGLAKNCKWKSTNVSRCLFPQYFADEIETQLFPLQSLFDPLQATMSKIDPDEHADWMQRNMNLAIWNIKKPNGLANGGFVYSCSRHCGGELLNISGFTAPTALETFMKPQPSRVLWLDHQPYPCKTCCNDPVYPPAVRLLSSASSATVPDTTTTTTTSSSSCSIAAYGARSGNLTDDAADNARAIQQALSNCSTVTVPAGVFKITPIVIPSHRVLHLELGASLVASERWEDYGVSHMLPPLGNSGTQPGMLMINPLISATDATNITITGANGTIDGNGWVGWPSANWSNPECGLHRHCATTRWTSSNAPGTIRPPQLVAITRSSFITITNVTFTNPAYWGVQHYFCNDTFMSHVTILAPRWTRQIAGFMPFSVRRYRVEDSYVAVGDDAVAIMSGPDFADGGKCQTDASVACPAATYSQPADGLVFRRVFVLGRSFALGSEDFGNITDVLIEDCTIGDDQGSSSHAFFFKMHSNCGNATRSQCRIGDIVVRHTKFGWIRNNTWQNPGNEGDFAIQIGMRYSDPPIDPSLPQPIMSNISFINVTATKVFKVLTSAAGAFNKVAGLHFIDCNFHATSPDPWVLAGVDAASCTSVNSFPPFPVLLDSAGI